MKLHYKILGEGKPLIILHGLFGTLDNWQSLGRKFSEDFKVYLVDQRNHGHSPHSDAMDYPLMADDLAVFMNDMQLDGANIIGHSMGGKTAMFFAQQHPDRVEKLVIADMGMKKYPPHHDVIFKSMLTLNLDEVKTRKDAEAHIRKYFNDTGVIQFLLKNLYWSDTEKLAWRMNLPVLHAKIENILAAVPEKITTVPTLFIRGTKSNYVPDEDLESIHSCFPNCRFASLDTGHWLHAEDPDGFYREVITFLQ